MATSEEEQAEGAREIWPCVLHGMAMLLGF
jgi:hypothetical protein